MRVNPPFRESDNTAKSEFSIPATLSALPRVDIIYAHANMSPDLITAAAANGAKGIVIAGVGDGNMTAPALEAVKQAVAKGVVVVRSSRVNGGIMRRNIEVNDDQIGTVASMELNPGKARVLLQLGIRIRAAIGGARVVGGRLCCKDALRTRAAGGNVNL